VDESEIEFDLKYVNQAKGLLKVTKSRAVT